MNIDEDDLEDETSGKSYKLKLNLYKYMLYIQINNA